MNREKSSKPHEGDSALKRVWLMLKRLRPRRLTASPATKAPSPASSRLCELMFCFLPDQAREVLVGDLAEEYRNRRIVSGRVSAAAWLCRQIPTSQRRLRSRYPVFKGVLARLKPILTSTRSRIQASLDGQYRMAPSYVAGVLMAFMSLTLVIYYLWNPVTESPAELASYEAPRGRPQEINSPRPESEPYPKPDPVPQETIQRREMPGRRQPRRERIQRRITSPDFVALRLAPLGITRSAGLSESSILHVPKHAKLVHLHLEIPKDSSPGLYTVELRSAEGKPLFTFQRKIGRSKSVIVSVPAKRLPEGTYTLYVLGETDLLSIYGFKAVKRLAQGCGAEGETRAASASVSPKCDLQPV